jgi:hydroxymethylglutaryl-CoA lyase
MAEKVAIFEVGVRDGLQNESRSVSTSLKTKFIRDLVAAGVSDIELGAFVRADKVPQMSDTDVLYQQIRAKKLKLGRTRAWALVPNRRGLERALEAGVFRIAVFTAATDGFTKKNIGMSVAESLIEYREVIREAKKVSRKIEVRGYVSTAFGCPYEGKVSPKKALAVAEKLAEIGADQISIGDTIGVATPRSVDAVMKPALLILGERYVAAHFHDTRGTALANALRSLELGVRTLDSSAGGLGGCPYAPGATGNLATEDLLYMLAGMGFSTGIHLPKLCDASLKLARAIRRPLTSRYLSAYASRTSKLW